jgi:hypothetical protein
MEKVSNAQDSTDTYETIRWAVKELNDGHSFFSTPAPRQVIEAAGDATPAESTAQPKTQVAPPDCKFAAASSPKKKKTRTVEGSGWVIASTAEDLRGEVITSTTDGRVWRPVSRPAAASARARARRRRGGQARARSAVQGPRLLSFVLRPAHVGGALHLVDQVLPAVNPWGRTMKRTNAIPPEATGTTPSCCSPRQAPRRRRTQRAQGPGAPSSDEGDP